MALLETLWEHACFSVCGNPPSPARVCVLPPRGRTRVRVARGTVGVRQCVPSKAAAGCLKCTSGHAAESAFDSKSNTCYPKRGGSWSKQRLAPGVVVWPLCCNPPQAARTVLRSPAVGACSARRPQCHLCVEGGRGGSPLLSHPTLNTQASDLKSSKTTR